MKIAVLGGDGFCGWPTSLHLSNAGHEVHIQKGAGLAEYGQNFIACHYQIPSNSLAAAGLPWPSGCVTHRQAALSLCACYRL